MTEDLIDHSEPGTDSQSRNAVRGAAVGFFVDMFDVYLPVVVLAPALIFFLSPQLSADAKAVASGGIFAATLIARPLGSIIFGVLADRIGRRRATLMAVIGCGASTTMTAMLPGFEQAGAMAIVLLIAVRLIGGIFMGGEYTGAVPLAMESSPIAKRAWYGGLIASAFPLAYCAISLISLFLLSVMSSDGLNSAYVQWGWRIPFLVGGLGTFWFAQFYARSVSESATWQRVSMSQPARGSKSIRSAGKTSVLFRGSNRRMLIRVFILMTGIWFASNVVSVLLPTMIRDSAGISSVGATFVWLLAEIALFGGYIAAGLLSQRIGRRKFFLTCGIAMATVSATAVTLISTGAINGYVTVTIVAIVALLAGTTTFGSVPTFVSESFPVDVRGAGYGLGFSLAIIIPAFYAFYQELLSTVIPSTWTPAALLVIGGILTVIGALIIPETRDRDMSLTTAELEGTGSATGDLSSGHHERTETHLHA